MALKVTYATMSADNEDLNVSFEEAVGTAPSRLGATHPLIINGERRATEATAEEFSPIDSEILIGRYSLATNDDIDDAMAAARAFASEWEAWGWERRRDLMLRAADIMEERAFEMAADMAFEIGKNRLEALGDIAETVEFFRYYARQITEHHGFVTSLASLSPQETNTSVLRPWGVWVVISPFNFPMALAAGPSIGALITGNTVVVKPSRQGALMTLEFHSVMEEAGLPPGALHVVTGDSKAGDYLAHHPDVDGLTFTGSYPVGMHLYRTVNEKRPKPVICEMGGKNPVVVTATADLDKAATGVMRSAFGLSGQKCSAASRVYVERSVYDDFVAILVEKTEQLAVGNPLQRDVYMGPVIDQGVVDKFRRAVAEVESSGGNVLAGGEVIEDDGLDRGNFVQPTVATAPFDSWIWKEELFMPFLAIGPVDSLAEGLERSNDTEFGLTAGLFATDEDEIERWFQGIQAGVTYVNREAGATTGAWPDIQSFGGWKGSGTSGTGGGGPWYLRQYLREQSRTQVRS
ncbi:MAG TPA: aldehyde dehydrogenase family protein [Acidimicrobiia bacterium]|nr:aldehyde dehydrogenase family protein [Acidimicrobiia bacterium]